MGIDGTRGPWLKSSTAGLALAIVAQSMPAHAQVQTYSFDIPTQDLDASLKAFARTAHQPVTFHAKTVRGKTARALKGNYPAKTALELLLRDSGLDVESGRSGVFIIRPRATTKVGQYDAVGDSNDAESMANRPSADAAPREAADAESETITVTAQKRTERLQDVPIPVAVLSARALLDSNQTQFKDYFNQVPGLSYAQTEGGASAISIRGITTGISQNPTVGFTIDDIPLGSSTSAGGAELIPEVNPADLAQVEVLRGPQGTLYGASSMGGLIRYVTVDPSSDSTFGTLQAGASGVHGGDKAGYNVDGAVNLPLSETFAFRASGFARRAPGYIDNDQTGQRGINEENVYGGRLSALWKLSPEFSLKLGALFERAERDGSNDVDRPTPDYPQTIGLGSLQQSYIRGSGSYNRKVQVYSAALKGKIGNFDLTAISAFNVSSFSLSADYTYLYGPLTQSMFGLEGTVLPSSGSTKKFTQEVRLSSPIGAKLELQLGAFYTHERSSFNANLDAEDAGTGAIVGNLFTSKAPTKYQEYAGFGNLTWHITDRLDLQIGGRESHLTETTLPGFLDGPLAGGPSVSPSAVTSANVFTYSVTPRFKLTPDFMIYARAASGYRAGGGDGNPSSTSVCVVFNYPCKYSPDKTQNYEVGIKGSLLDHKLSVDASLFYIDWKNIQLSLLSDSGLFVYTGNGNKAKSEGLEISTTAKPLVGLTISAWGTWTNAVLTEAFPPGPAYGASGDRLPYSSRFSGNISVQQDFPLANGMTGFVGGKLVYVGARKGEFTASSERQNLGAYTQVDLSAGIKRDPWTVNLYVNNVADGRGALYGGLGGYPPFAFLIIQPRTIGMSVRRAF